MTQLPPGRTEIAPTAVAGMVVAAVRTIPEVVGLAPEVIYPGTVPALPWDQARRGVRLQAGPPLKITIGLIIAYGAPVAAIAAQVEAAVSAAVRHGLGRDDLAVSVQIQGLQSRSPQP